MAKKKRQEEAVETAPVTRETVRRALRVTGWTLGVVVVVFGTAAALLEGGEFLSTDKRFLMPEAGTRAEDACERRTAHICRIRLAASLLESGKRQAAGRICEAVLASDAGEPQKKAARRTLALYREALGP